MRCVIPSIDQTTGLAAPDPTPTLKKFRWNKALRGRHVWRKLLYIKAASAMLHVGVEARCHPRYHPSPAPLADYFGRA